MKSRIPIGLVMMLVALVLSFVPAATITAQPAAAASICDAAQFVTDVTVPDGMSFAPSATFTKTWRLKNIGTCTWTKSYALVFSSGSQLGGPSSVNLPSPVNPGDTVDLSINLKAPNAAGNYTGFWQFKNASGVLFGIGSTANKTWWVEINVSGGSTTPGVAYDFAANYCSANWTSTAGSLPCPGTDGAPNGFVLQVSNPTLEDGSTVSGLGLITNPQNGFNGDIHGAFPPFHVQNGDHFKSIVNCSRNAPNCFVTFRLDYQIGNGAVNTFWTFREKFDGLFFPANIDLSPLAGQDVKFILTVLATGSPTGDRALWVNPVITRAGATPPTPGPGTPPTPIPTACDRAQFVTDVTVPDGTAFAAGAAITKTWRLKNVGTCTWTTAYSMAFDSGAQMGGPNSVPMPKTVKPGDTVDLTVPLTAPTATGSYKGFWSFRNASGVRFALGSAGTISWWVDLKVTTAPISFQYDFGTSTSPVAVGYTRVTETTAFTSGGFGWTDTSTLESRDRGGPDDLKRDFVMSSSAARTFQVALPNKTYTVVVTQGDASFAHDKMVVKANGTTVLSNVSTASGSFAVNSFTATVSNGLLSLEFSDGGGSDPSWVVNGVLISNVTPLPSDCDRAQFVTDVTVQDGTVFAPNAAIAKTWRLKNIGTCTWTTSYSMVFDSGDKMSGPDSVAMPKSVAPGTTVDVPVNLIAPSAGGDYRGFWKFQNASGVRFGIGPGGTSPWWVAIHVAGPTPTPGTPTPTATPVAGVQYDFAANACSAVWLSGAVKLPNKLPCPGTDGDSRGFVLPVSSPKLETGAVDPRMGLVTFPQNVFNGYIQGIYPPYHVQAGDRFRSIVNCSFGATSCFVMFRLDYQTGSDPIKNFWAFTEKYDNKFGTADVPLGLLVGKDVKFILTVASAGSPTGDRALWVAPMIFNPAGVTPTPTGTPGTPTPTSTAVDTTGWGTFTNTKYGFSFKIPPSSTIASQTDNAGRVNLPILTSGTNLGEKYIEVKVVDGATASTCKDPYTSQGTGPAYTSANVTINGIQFLKETNSDAAAGNIYDWVGYSTLKGTSCISLTFILHSTNPGMYTTPPPLFDKAAESAIFPTIMTTFASANSPASGTNTPVATATPTATATPPATASTASVSIINISFQPSSLQVKAGTTVTWTNNDNTAHTVTSDTAGVFDSGTLAVGSAFSFTFSQTGTFAYHCNIHSTMHGTITVVP